MNDQEVREAIVKLNTRVAKLERQIEFLLGQSSIPYTDEVERDYRAIIQLKQQGNLIGAIKLYREQTNASLADAKTFVESL